MLFGVPVLRFGVAEGHSVFGLFMAVLTAREASRLVWSAYRLGMLKSLACSGVFVVEARVSFCNEVADVLGFLHCSDHAQSHGASRKRNLLLSTSEEVRAGDQLPGWGGRGWRQRPWSVKFAANSPNVESNHLCLWSV